MSRRTIASLTATAIIGIACIVTVSTDAFAYRRGGGVGGWVALVFITAVSIAVASIVVQPCAVASCVGVGAACGRCCCLRSLRSLRRLSPLRLRTLPPLLLAGLGAAATE
jgi:hypothetical protein